MRRNAKVDGNQTVIVDGLRRCGCSVAVTSPLGDGFPDIVVGRQGFNFLLELKDPKRPPSKRRLTEDQVAFRRNWRGQIATVETLREAMTAVGLMG